MAATPPSTPFPWEGTAERADRFLFAGIIFSGLYALALLPAVPALIGTHPVLLEVFRGSMTSMVTMGALAREGEASLAVAFFAGLPGTMMFDWLYWWAGRRWGERGLMTLVGNHPKGPARVAKVRRLAERFGAPGVVFAYIQPLPTALIYAAAGWTGMRLATFLVLDLIGSMIWVGLMVGLGFAVGEPVVDVAKAISRYALLFTVALIAVIVARSVWRERRAGT